MRIGQHSRVVVLVVYTELHHNVITLRAGIQRADVNERQRYPCITLAEAAQGEDVILAS